MSSSNNTSQHSGEVEHWIEVAQQGSLEALGQVLEYCRPYLLAVANQQLASDIQAKIGASDLVQDTLMEAQRDFAHFHGRTEDEVLAWLRQVLLHNVANLVRQYRDTDKRQVQREISLGEASAEELLRGLVDEGSSPSEVARGRERDEALERALVQLPEVYRQVIQWRTYERCSFEEVGRRLQRSAGAARKIWARAIEQLQEILGPSDEV